MALHHFIFDKDIHDSCRPNLFESLVESNRTIRKKVAAAMGQVTSKLSARYVMDEIFITLEEWNSTDNYVTGDHRYVDDVVYVALQDNTGKRPTSSPNDWKEEDPRDQTIVSCVVALALWHLFKPVAMKKKPDQVVEDYDEWMEWLEDVRNALENPDLPIKEDGTEEVRHGSDDMRDHIY